MRRTEMIPAAALMMAALTLGSVQPSSGERDERAARSATGLKIPEPVKAEHDELHAELVQATNAGGKTGEAAQMVARLLRAHFEKEERFALPPLGLLAPLAEGKVTAEMGQAIALTDRLRSELPQMLQEHRSIVAAIKDLRAAADQEGKPEHARFAANLMQHVRTEEEVTYPAAILVGEYLKLKLGKSRGTGSPAGGP